MLCVLDRTPRTLEEAQKESLRMLARQVMSQLELHRELAAHQASRHLLEYSQDELRASKALYQSLVEHVPLLILRKDKEGRFTFGNQLICDALHCQPGDLEGKTDFDFLPTELAQKFRANDEWVLATGEVVETIEELPRPGEASIHAQIITSCLAGNSCFLDAAMERGGSCDCVVLSVGA